MDGFDVTLNGLNLASTDDDGNEWRTTSLSGWFGTPSSTLAPVQKSRAPGAWASDTQDTPRSVAAGGLVQAASRTALQAAFAKLSAACTKGPSALVVADPDDSSTSTSASVRRQDAVICDLLTDSLGSWSIQVVALDPRRLGVPQSETTGLPSSVGGLTFPFTFPVTFASSVVTGLVTLTNEGVETGPVVLRIDGPVTGPVVTHIGSGRRLVFSSSLVIESGQWLDVDMDRQRAMLNGVVSRNGYITQREWSGFDPGANQWAFTAQSGSGSLTVTATPAW